MEGKPQVERWDVFELQLEGPSEGNPFCDVQLAAVFALEHRELRIDGFYDGEGRFLVRFMPDEIGAWRYVTESNCDDLDGVQGGFECVAPGEGNHGPVSVRDGYHFRHADGWPHYSVGTTCYAWAHQRQALRLETLRTLSEAPFNKLRMCVFPKWYPYNQREPELHAFEPDGEGGWDYARLHPAYFQGLDACIEALMGLGIEADLILFHPYDKWGYAEMGAETDAFFLRYVVARFAAYRNVWWSMANEFDLMKKSMTDWDRIGRLVHQLDPYGHPRSIHNCRGFYDHAKAWVTHASVQHSDLERVGEWRHTYGKPVVVDECRYEGDIPRRWGNISARELTHRFWEAFARGGYAGHGETYLKPSGDLWWSHGGVLHGDSPARIAFLREVMEQGEGGGWEPVDGIVPHGYACVAKSEGQYLVYMGLAQPSELDLHLSEDKSWTIELLNPWEMAGKTLHCELSGKQTVKLPGRPYLALRIVAQD